MSSRSQLPRIVKPERGRRDLVEVLSAGREWEQSLLECGALLFRGFEVFDVAAFELAVEAFSPNRMAYVYRSTPRTTVGNRIFSATEYPSQLRIPLHSENAFQREWPLRIVFGCMLPASQGGETPLADVRKVTSRIQSQILDRFENRRVTYVRHYHEYVDLPWQTVFQVDNRRALSEFCLLNDIAHQWLDNDTLRTSQVAQGVATHPVTSDRLWFNQAHLFHISSIGASAARSLLDFYGADRLPRQAYYGDGGEISKEDLDNVRQAFEAEMVVFRWETGDFLLLDNMLTAHGRAPFKGERSVIAALLEPYSPASKSKA